MALRSQVPGAPLGPILIWKCLSLCPSRVTLMVKPRGGRRLESQKAFEKCCSNSTEPLLFSPWQFLDKARQMTLRIAEMRLGTDKEWKVGKTKIFLKVSS